MALNLATALRSLFVGFLLTSSALAAPGSLDPAFGPAGTGAVRTGFGNGVEEGHAVAYQPDGKFVVAATSSRGAELEFSLVRYATDGTLDPTFGQGGRTTTDFGLLRENAQAVVRQLDGKILVAGTGNNIFLLIARFNVDGTIDPTFSGDGRVTELVTPASTQDYRGMVLQADGKILVCGSASGDFVIVRYNTDGTRDTSFDGDGVVRSDIYDTTELRAIAVQSDGMILGVGYTVGPAQTQSMAVVRLNPNGSFDTTFSGDGKVAIAALPNLLAGNALGLQISPASFKILVAGGASISGTVDMAVARLNADGSLDTTFDSDGIVILPLTTGNSIANAIRVQYAAGNPSRIYIAGDGNALGGYYDTVVAKLFLAGGLDTAFDADGIVVVSLGTENDGVSALMMNNSSKVLAVGHATGPASTDLATVLLNSNGTLDTAWDQDGKRRDNFADQSAGATSVAIQPDGKIVAGGFTQGMDGVHFALARYSTDGTLDPTFDGDGRSLPDIGDMDYSAISALAALPNGTILAAGVAETAAASDEFAIARFEPNGVLDASFGEGGIVLAGSDIPNRADIAYDLAIQPDQKVLVAGAWYPNQLLPLSVGVLRLTPDGIIDTNFGTQGWASISIPSAQAGARAVAVAPSGAIYAAGYRFFGGNSIVLARFTSAGMPDSTFDQDGYAVSSLSAGANSIALQSDGKIVIGAVSTGGITSVLRFLASGALDFSFGGTGEVDVPGIATNAITPTLIIQPDGKILVAGGQPIPAPQSTVIVRLLPNGSFDPTFDQDGIAYPDLFPLGDDVAYAMTRDGAGRIVLAGISGGLLGVARLEGDGATAAIEIPGVRAGGLALGRPFPNPMREIVALPFESASDAPIDAAVIDVAGRRVRVLRMGEGAAAGSRTIRWDGMQEDGRPVAPGVYYMRVQQGDASGVRPVTVVR